MNDFFLEIKFKSLNININLHICVICRVKINLIFYNIILYIACKTKIKLYFSDIHLTNNFLKKRLKHNL